MKTRVVKLIGVVLAVCMLLSACGSVSSPEKTMTRLESALHRADFEAVLDCFEPRVGRGIRAAAKLTGGLFGIDGEAVLELLPLVVDIFAMTDETGSYAEMERSLETIRIEVTGVTYSDDGYEATVSLNVSAQGETESGRMDLVKQDGEWYIKVT